MTVHIEGLGQLQRTLRRAGVDMKEFRAINRAAASVVARAAEPIAPRGKTGKLAASVRSAGSTNRAGVVRAGGGRVKYAGPIHWGWPARGIRARPFLSRAARSSESEWLELYTEHMHRVIRQIEGR